MSRHFRPLYRHRRLAGLFCESGHARRIEITAPRHATLLLGQKARDDNYIDLAEYITERATQLFDEAIIVEQSYKSASRAL
jgi:hypothetical protein